MLLSIIGNLFGQEDGDGQATSGNDGELMDGGLSGSMSEEELLPGAQDGGGSDDDLFGGDDPFDDGGLDDSGGMSLDEMDDEPGGVSSEVESRVEEMENDVGSLSSTVNTVQSENEQIRESIEEIEENIRKLLEVYEMVTQGVNPFVEGDSLSDTLEGGARGTGDFGGESLFDAGETAEADDAVEDDIANAEAEEFLDESLLDDDAGFDDESLDDEFESDSGGGDENLSFDELKSEYDSGDADWDADADGTDAPDDFDDSFAEDEPELDEETAELEGSGLDDGTGLDDGSDFDDIEHDALGDDSDDELEESGPESETLWPDDDRPYLASVPAAYETELLAMDWVEHLVGEVGLDDAARTIRFYRSIDWVSPSVETYLQTLLNGFDGGPEIDDPDPCSSLGVDHKRSLWWISQIATPEMKRLSYEEWLGDQTLAALRDEGSGGRSERVTYAESTIDDDRSADEFGSSTIGSDRSTETHDDRWTEHESAERVGVGAREDELDGEVRGDELDERSAQKIFIDEGDRAVDESRERERPAIAEPSVDADGERMIWVDSDVVLSESGVELRIRPDEYDRGEPVEYVHSVFESDRGGESGELEQWRKEYIKPLVVPDDGAGLERWQVELIKSLFAPDDDARGR